MAFMWLENKYTGNRNVYDIVLVEDVPYNGADKQNRQSGDAPNSKGGKSFIKTSQKEMTIPLVKVC